MRNRSLGSAILILVTLITGLVSATTAFSSDTVILSRAAEKAKHATVGILRSPAERGSASGPRSFSIRASGTHIGNGFILTARHAIERQEGGQSISPETIQVMTTDLHELEAKLVGVNAFLDIAVYHISGATSIDTLGQASFAQADPLSGEEVFTVGYPLGWGPALSFGRVGNPTTFLDTIQSRLLQIDLSACSGNSGGGLFNPQGEIVGVVHAIIKTETTQGERRCSRFAFAVPGTLAQKIVRSLIDGKPIKFSKLGLKLSVVKQHQHWAIAVAKATGPARQGGFKKGDIVLAIDDHPIHTAAQLKNYLIEHTRPGQQVAIKILRNQKRRILKVILGNS